MGLMEVLWYTRQLKRIAAGGSPRANESGLAAFLKSLVSTQWGTYKTRRLLAPETATATNHLPSHKAKA